MKNLMVSLLVAVALLPAAQVKQEETQRGADALINTTVESIANASAKNAGHTWLRTRGYNLAQRYNLQKELEKKGYDFDMPLIGSTFIGW